jgi:hypothetical protein
MSWKDECNNLGVPHEAMEVKIGFLIKEVKIDTSSIAKRFCLDNTLIRSYGDGRYYYCGLDEESNDVQIAHIEGDRLVHDIKPLFSIGETFELSCSYEDDGGAYTSIETYKITGYDLSGCFAKGIVYLGDAGSAWIPEDSLVDQKSKFKIGEKFEVHFEYYEDGEFTEHTVTRIDFSKMEYDEVLYCDDKTMVSIPESELIKYKFASSKFTIVDEDGYQAISGRYFASDDDVQRLESETDACYTGGGEFYIESIGSLYRDRGLHAYSVFLARSAFCVQAQLIGKGSVDFVIHSSVISSVLTNAISTTEQLEGLVSETNKSTAKKQQGMNVGQLIAELQKLDPDKLVTIVVGNEDNNIIDTTQFELHATDDDVEYVEFFVLG